MQKSTTMVVPPANGGLGAPLEIVRGYAAHEAEFEMGMRIDAARHHVAAAGIDHLGAGGRIEGGTEPDDFVAINKHVCAPGMIVVHHRAAADQDRHGIS